MTERPPALGSPEPTQASQLSAGLTRKLVIAMLFAALVYAAMMFYGEARDLRHTASSFAPSAFALGLALAACNYGLRIARWQYYLRLLGLKVPLGESSVVFLSAFVMSVSPGKIGEVFKSLLLYESRGIPITRTAPIVVAERLTDLIALVLLVAFGATSFDHGWVVAATSAAAVAALCLVCSYRKLGYFLLGLTERIPVISKLSHKLHEAYDALLDMTRPVPLVTASTLALLAWGLECGSLFAIVHGFTGVHMTWRGAVFAYSAPTIAGAVAMMPGGLGVTEVGMTALLRALGGPAMRPAVAAASTILVRIATLWFAVAIGAVALFIYRAFWPQRRAVAAQ